MTRGVFARADFRGKSKKESSFSFLLDSEKMRSLSLALCGPNAAAGMVLHTSQDVKKHFTTISFLLND
jgi:hypothetical protein